MNTKQIQAVKLALSDMNMAELRQVNEYLSMMFKQQIRKASLTFSRGDEVKFDHPSEGTVFGKVVKINSKTVSVVTKEGSHWRVAGSLLTMC